MNVHAVLHLAERAASEGLDHGPGQWDPEVKTATSSWLGAVNPGAGGTP